MEKVRQWYHSERKKLAGMPAGKRLSYIAEYYGLWIAGIIFLIGISGYVIYRANFTVKEHWFYAVYANTMTEAGEGSDLWKDFAAYTGYDLTEKRLTMNDSSYFDPSLSNGTNNSYFQSFVALVESGDLDVITMGQAGLMALGSSGRLMDLTSEAVQQLFDGYSDRFVYALPYDTEYSTVPVPIGIDVSDSLLVTRYGLYEDDCVLGISAYSAHVEEAASFLTFILEE